MGKGDVPWLFMDYRAWQEDETSGTVIKKRVMDFVALFAACAFHPFPSLAPPPNGLSII